jgi:ZIP family zinc transporter
VSNLGPLVGWGIVVAASLVAGAVTAAVLRLPARVVAVVTAFGGGVLLAAVASSSSRTRTSARACG